MGELDRDLVQELKERIPIEVRSHLRQLILYGSRARGEAAEDSDLDLLALVDHSTPWLEETLDEIAYKIMWDHDFKPIISLKVMTEERFRKAAAKGFSFYRHVEQEGIPL